MDSRQRRLQGDHNFLRGRVIGTVITIRGTLQQVLNSPSTTPESKKIASRLMHSIELERQLNELVESFQYRVNLDGSTTKMKLWIKGKGYDDMQETIKSLHND